MEVPTGVRRHQRTQDRLLVPSGCYQPELRRWRQRLPHVLRLYARGLETVGGSYYLLEETVLDETALGQKEDWEEPKGRATEAPGAISDFS
jgi:hypothetical protein